jgi:hypothetical protein
MPILQQATRLSPHRPTPPMSTLVPNSERGNRRGARGEVNSLPHSLIQASILGLLLLSLLPHGSLTAQSGARPLIVAYVDGDTLYTWRQDNPTPQVVAKGQISRPLLSPAGSRVAFQSGDALWLAEVNRQNSAHVLVAADTLGPARRVLNVDWLDDSTLIFNTFVFHPKRLVKQQFADDLWRADAASDQVIRLLEDGQGGAFTVSPAGIALALPGDSTSPRPGMISWVNARGQNKVKLLEYAAVNTGSSQSFYARPQWSADGASLFVAIPEPDLLYATQTIPPTVLWRLELTGKATRLGEVRADFFGLPEFSVTGQQVLYTRRIGPPADNQIALYQTNSDGSGEQLIAQDVIGKIEPAHWLPDGLSYTFVHGNPGELWAQTGPVLQRFSATTTAFNLIWVEATSVVYATAPAGEDELRYQVGIGGPQPTVIAKRSLGGDFDARQIP